MSSGCCTGTIEEALSQLAAVQSVEHMIIQAQLLKSTM